MQRRTPSLGQAFLVPIWLGALAGLTQVAAHALKKWGFGSFALTTPQVVWMAPLAYMILFVPVGLLWWAAARRFHAARSLAWLVAPLAAVGMYGALLVLRVELMWWAMVALSVGVAFRAAQVAQTSPDRLLLAAQRSVPWLLALILAGGAGYNAYQIVAERRALAALAPARDGTPNVLLLILDTARAMSMSVYGHDRPTTPELEELGREGVVFEAAVAPSSWSNPSHASILTGRHPHEHGADWDAVVDPALPTLAEVLRDRGVVTGGFVANKHYLAREWGLGRGFIHYDDYPVTLGGVLATTRVAEFLFSRASLVGRFLGLWDRLGRKPAPEVIEPFLDWMPPPGGRPFFAMLNLMDAHDPFLPPEPFRSRFAGGPPKTTWDRIRSRLPGADDPSAASPEEEHAAYVARERALYEGEIAYLDQQLGSLFDELEAAGQLDRTIIIVTADHGEGFNERGVMGHGRTLNWHSVHVPLVLRWPAGIPAGVRVSAPVGLRSLPATVMTLLGDAEDAHFPGHSLTRYWDGTPDLADTALAELSRPQDDTEDAVGIRDLKSLTAGRWHYIRRGDGAEFLFDIGRDRLGVNDLADSADPGLLARFRAALDDIPWRERRLTQSH